MNGLRREQGLALTDRIKLTIPDEELLAFAGLVVYLGRVPEATHAIVLMERLTGRQLGSIGREIVAATEEMLREEGAAS